MCYTSQGGIVPYLAFADDMILFTRLSRRALIQIQDFLAKYQSLSGQKVNTDKSTFIVSKRASFAGRRCYTGFTKAVGGEGVSGDERCETTGTKSVDW